MSEATALVVPATQERSLSLFELTPALMVKFASDVANRIKDIIERQHLYSNISGKKYVKFEGWQIAAAMSGLTPKEKSCVELEDGSYLAEVELVSTRSGLPIGGASALCGIDEKRWGGADRYARRSMAITRAGGKACRLSLGWIVALAGYETTPFEEMPDETPTQPRQFRSAESDAGKPTGSYKITANQIKRLYAIAKSKNWTQEEVRKVALQAFGVTSFNDLKKDDYDALITTIETKSPAEAVTSAAEFTDNVPEVGEVPF